MYSFFYLHSEDYYTDVALFAVVRTIPGLLANGPLDGSNASHSPPYPLHLPIPFVLPNVSPYTATNMSGMKIPFLAHFYGFLSYDITTSFCPFRPQSSNRHHLPAACIFKHSALVCNNLFITYTPVAFLVILLDSHQ